MFYFVKGWQHQRAIVGILRDVGLHIEAAGEAIGIPGPIVVVMPHCDPVQPDYLLIRTERTSIISVDGFVHGVPDLIAEVLSPNNPELDTVTERAAYARAGVPEYWIVRPASRDVLVCSEPDASFSDFMNVRLFGSDSELVSPTLPARVAVADLFEPPSTPAS
ncbi:MAG TPA: Uma2 family endonuclease [Thermomicrobiales bacterium]|nr:Uma2 family endonuclease [Thermomicrobiales bacterium]